MRLTYERYMCNSRDQKEGESIDVYIGELRTLAQTCNFCPCLHHSLIRDRIVLGVHAGSGPGRGHCVVFLGKTLYSHGASLTQVYKWVPANLMLGVTLRWTSIPSRGE